jgi:hypothetical protein
MTESRNNQFQHDKSPASGEQASVQPVEPENPAHHHQPAQRAALDEKQQGSQNERHPAEVAGQHATGSFTDKK